jgi:hypothetical protein
MYILSPSLCFHSLTHTNTHTHTHVHTDFDPSSGLKPKTEQVARAAGVVVETENGEVLDTKTEAVAKRMEAAARTGREYLIEKGVLPPDEEGMYTCVCVCVCVSPPSPPLLGLLSVSLSVCTYVYTYIYTHTHTHNTHTHTHTHIHIQGETWMTRGSRQRRCQRLSSTLWTRRPLLSKKSKSSI